MSALEREIIEKFHQLQPDAKQRVRAFIEQEMEQADSSAFDYEAWMRDAEALRQQIRIDHGGKLPVIDVVGILRDIRDGEDE
ncbi:MAG: hypothetical protein GC204_01900 [Chloroflexi bacterium]|nr:hypothetical protein [Chloroflexota bacterium]